MQKSFLFLFLATFFLANMVAQQKQITVEDIYSGTFRTEGLDALRSLANGKQYTILNYDRKAQTTAIDTYDYKTLQKIGTVVSSTELPEVPNFTSYEYSTDETKLLLASDVESIFRRSTLGLYHVYDIASKKFTKIANAKIQEPSLSPDGKQVAYVLNNNLYTFNIATGETSQLTTDGVKNKIINGVTDWVYEEEFSFVRAFEWNSEGTKIAFLRFDETKVPEFSMDVYGTELYQKPYVFKYPKAGENNAIVTLHMYDIATGTITDVDLGNAYYIPRIKWMNDPNSLSVQTINRHQNDLKLHHVNAKDNSVILLLEEKDEAYVDIHDNLTFLADDSFIWSSEKDGWNHIYLHSEDGKLMNQITKGPWEVTAYYGYDQNEDKVYYQSTENGSINRGVYSIDSNGMIKKALAAEAGTNDADFSADFTYFIKTFSSAATPPTYTLHKALTGKNLKDIKDNSALLTTLKSYEIAPKEFSTIAINGNDLNMYMIKPKDFDISKKYPLFMTQYSGPGSQSVSNGWMSANDYWHQM
ncbi:MAG: DPP IV N-terminal domain-containing protein, partial [Flavobacteriaceae bacterium]